VTASDNERDKNKEMKECGREKGNKKRKYCNKTRKATME